MNKVWKDKIFGIGMLLLCIAMMAYRVTGEKVHGIGAVVLIVISIVHLIKNRKRMCVVSTSYRIVDRFLIGSLTCLVISGVMIHPPFGSIVGRVFHVISGMVFTLSCFGHIIQHKEDAKEKEQNYVS